MLQLQGALVNIVSFVGIERLTRFLTGHNLAITLPPIVTKGEYFSNKPKTH